MNDRPAQPEPLAVPQIEAARLLSVSEQTIRKWLVEHFGEHKDIRTITRGDAADWHRLIKSKLAQATVSGYVKKARQIFEDARDRKLIAENPLEKLKAGSQDNPRRMEYVTEATVRKVIDATADKEWRLLFALARWGGLRIPSETNALRWSDVRWDDNRILIRSPKTEHHAGKGEREIPLFPELVPYLLDVFEDGCGGVDVDTQRRSEVDGNGMSPSKPPVSQHGESPAQEHRQGSTVTARPAGSNPARSPFVFVRLRGANLRTQANRIITEKAGLKPWGKTFVNLRSSRETDLAARFPLHVVCAWIGNSPRVAQRHYLQVTDVDYSKASEESWKAEPAPSADESTATSATPKTITETTTTDASGAAGKGTSSTTRPDPTCGAKTARAKSITSSSAPTAAALDGRSESAATSAAIGGQSLPKTTKHPEQNVQETQANRENQTPATGGISPADLLADLQETERTLTQALTTAHEVAVRTRVSDLADLERAIDAAKGAR
jgi:integrase